MSNKRYYWLKLKDSFFEDDTITWLEEQENGKDYVLFYLKLALKSLEDEGKLIRYVGETLIPYDVKALAKLTNTSVDTVAVAMKLFIDIGLVANLETGEIYMNQINELIGSETEVAKRVRKHRARNAIENKENKPLLQCNNEVTKCNTEIEIEKELDTELEKEIEKDLFAQFWNAYPKKVSKGQALKTFNKVVKDEETLNLILADLEKRKRFKQWTENQGQFIPYPSSYLNNQGWLDEYETEKEFVRMFAIRGEE